jgi:hypothetical protein
MNWNRLAPLALAVALVAAASVAASLAGAAPDLCPRSFAPLAVKL